MWNYKKTREFNEDKRSKGLRWKHRVRGLVLIGKT